MTIIIDLSTGTFTPDLAELRTQLRERGFDFLTDPECDRLLNASYQEICDLEDWPFLADTATGAAPLTISDLRTVTSVWEPSLRRRLDLTSHDDLTRRGLDVSTAGSPCEYWIDGLDTVRTWPVGGNLSVRYIKTPDALVNPDDEPVIPARFRDVIVTGAARVAATDQSAGVDADALGKEYDRRLDVMRQVLLDQSADTGLLLTVGGGDW